MDRYGKWFMQAQHIEQCNPVVYFRLLTFKHNFLRQLLYKAEEWQTDLGNQ